MKILNLTDLSKSDINYIISKFPDGQQSIILSEDFLDTEDHIESITIKTRLNNFMDLEILICAVKALRTWGIFYPIDLYVPYFLGSRSDRTFCIYSPNYLRDVICPIINSLNFNSVTLLDPHSDVLEACLNNFRKISNFELLEFGLSQIYYNKPNMDSSIKKNLNDFILVSPDAGASKKIYKLAEKIGYKGDVITCSKDRDSDGKLTRTIVPELPINKDIIIIDDICDGGATFINIAKEIKKQYNNVDKPCQGKIYLIVTHGIFSKGTDELSKYFDGIYCTNSYRDIGMLDKDYKFNLKEPFIKQLNVF